MNNNRKEPTIRNKRTWHVKHEPEFKKKVALEYLTSGKTLRNIASQYPLIHYTQVGMWAKELQKELKIARVATLPISMAKTVKQNLDDLSSDALMAELKLANYKIAGLETMISIAENQLGISIKKKFGTKQ